MKTITVQPVAVTYTRIGGIPVGRADRPGIAWYGDMPFIAHFSRLIGRGGIDAVVSFGEPIRFDAGYRPQEGRRAVLSLRCARWTRSPGTSSSAASGDRRILSAAKRR